MSFSQLNKFLKPSLWLAWLVVPCVLSAALYASQKRDFIGIENYILDSDRYGVPLIIGNARNKDTGEHLYTEYHYLDWQDAIDREPAVVSPDSAGVGRYSVVYRDNQGRVIAVKKLQHEAIGSQPAVAQVNYLVGEVIEVRPAEQGKFSVSYREDERERQKQKSLVYGDALVVDAGFDDFIRKNWALGEGDKLQFDFLAPSRLTTFSFDLKSVGCADEASVKCFEAAPSSWLLRRFVEPIRVRYDAQDKRLLTFSGLGNIADASGDYMSVEIDYKYPSYHF